MVPVQNKLHHENEQADCCDRLVLVNIYAVSHGVWSVWNITSSTHCCSILRSQSFSVGFGSSIHCHSVLYWLWRFCEHSPIKQIPHSIQSRYLLRLSGSSSCYESYGYDQGCSCTSGQRYCGHIVHRSTSYILPHLIFRISSFRSSHGDYAENYFPNKETEKTSVMCLLEMILTLKPFSSTHHAGYGNIGKGAKSMPS
uniref:Uncharacterized protein n=1 Tax=Cacopsylla melanoneura TaxID=428564 RepID=A0A8D9APA0_9HEMI